MFNFVNLLPFVLKLASVAPAIENDVETLIAQIKSAANGQTVLKDVLAEVQLLAGQLEKAIA